MNFVEKNDAFLEYLTIESVGNDKDWMKENHGEPEGYKKRSMKYKIKNLHVYFSSNLLRLCLKNELWIESESELMASENFNNTSALGSVFDI